jgi:hypothetical protein
MSLASIVSPRATGLKRLFCAGVLAVSGCVHHGLPFGCHARGVVAPFARRMARLVEVPTTTHHIVS